MDRSMGAKIAVVAGVVALAVAAFVARGVRRSGDPGAGGAPDEEVDTALPRLVDLGSQTCTPCKMMEPVLEELRREYAGRLRVEFIDVKADPEAGRRYGVSVIPTQIWFDASGKELLRHEGFIPKDDILEMFRMHGVDLGGQAAQTLPAGNRWRTTHDRRPRC